MLAVQPQELLDAVQEVGPDHGDLIDDDGIELPVKIGPLAADLLDLIQRDIGLEPAERV